MFFKKNTRPGTQAPALLVLDYKIYSVWGAGAVSSEYMYRSLKINPNLKLLSLEIL